ncbi:MAG: tyrosine-type recombinase/integrase [Gaiellaceae bacterium]
MDATQGKPRARRRFDLHVEEGQADQHHQHDQSRAQTGAVEAGLGEWIETKKGKRAESWVGFHTFRHSTATRLFIGQNWNAVQVAKFLGHTDAGFTLRTYVHLLPEDLPAPDFGVNVGNTWATQASEISRNVAPSVEVISPSEQEEVSAALGAAGL